MKRKIWSKVPKVICLLCDKPFRRITNTHLWKEHQTTMEEYKQQFPDAEIDDAPGDAGARVAHFNGQHYCMVMRGVRQVDSITVTSSLKGLFLEKTDNGIAARAELMSLIRN